MNPASPAVTRKIVDRDLKRARLSIESSTSDRLSDEFIVGEIEVVYLSTSHGTIQWHRVTFTFIYDHFFDSSF